MTKSADVSINPLAGPPQVADRNTIRAFVRNLDEVSEKIKEARDDLKEAISSNDEIETIDDEIKKLRERRKEIISESPVIKSYKEIVEECIEEKKQLIYDAKQDGVPRKEIGLAIKALKQDIDMAVSTEVYSSIADLVG